MTMACSTCTRPSASATRVWRRSVSRACASRTWRWASRRVSLVWWAHQFAVEVAPVSVAGLELVGVDQDADP